MELKIFISEIVTKWLKSNKFEKKQLGLSGAISPIIGEKGENYALKKLKEHFPNYEFLKTDNSKSPADIIGLKKSGKFWHFALYQVKTSLDKSNLTKNIPEKETLPILAKIIKDNFIVSEQTKRVKKRPLFITIGYIGVHSTETKNGFRNKIIKSSAYSKTFSLNNLNLQSKDKTKLKNKIHKIEQ